MLATQLTRLRFDELPPNYAGHVAFWYRANARKLQNWGWLAEFNRDKMFEYTRITIFGGEL